MAAALVLLASPSGAHAAATAPDTPGGDQEETDFYFGGLITFDGEPVPDVVIMVEGGGYEPETDTDAACTWGLYVTAEEEYVLSVAE